MTPPRPESQQELLNTVKSELGVDWDTLALRAGIKPRALKSYRLPSSSKGFRAMPALAQAAVEDLRCTSPAPLAFRQQEFLRGAMATLDLTWQQLAEAAGINPFTFKNYLRAATARAHRPLPPLAKAAIDRLLRDGKSPKRRAKRA